MHFFGLWGTIFFLIGLSSFVYLIVAKFIDSDFTLTNKPAFYIALAAVIGGMQLFLSGFVAELVARNAAERNVYLIEDKIGLF